MSLAPNLTETLFAVGAGGQVVGVSDACDRPAEAARLPHVGPIVAPSVESVLALSPDLVLATAEGNPLATLERLRALGVPVFGVASPAPGLQGVAGDIRTVARAAGHEQEGELAARELEARVEAVRRGAAGRPRRSACTLVWTDPLIAAGRGTFLHDLADAAGLDDACAARTEGEYPRLSREELILAAPQLLLLATGDSGSRLEGTWAEQVPAVRDHRVLRLDDRFLRPTPRLGEAVEALAADVARLEAEAAP